MPNSSSAGSSSSSSIPFSLAGLRDSVKSEIDSKLSNPAQTLSDAAASAIVNAIKNSATTDGGGTMPSAVSDALKSAFSNIGLTLCGAAKDTADSAVDNYPFTTTTTPTSSLFTTDPSITLSAGPISWTNTQNSPSVNYGSLFNNITSGNYSVINPVNNLSATIKFTPNSNLSVEIGGTYSNTLSTPTGSRNNVWGFGVKIGYRF